MRGTLAAEQVTKEFGATVVLDRVSLVVPEGARIGVVGPNGAGKSTLLRVLASVEEPDAGRVVRRPPTLTVGYLPQEHERRPRGAEDAPVLPPGVGGFAADASSPRPPGAGGFPADASSPRPPGVGGFAADASSPAETLLVHLARRTGVADAEAAMDALAARLADEPALAHTYNDALERFLALGGADFAARAREAANDVGLAVPLHAELPALSGGEAARVSLAALLLDRHDVLCLDEPTNDLDFDGLARLERFVHAFEGAIVVVSHDREFLDRTVTRVVVFDSETRKVHEFAGTYGEWERRRAAELERQARAYAEYSEQRERFESLLNERRGQARAGFGLGEKSGGSDRRGTRALRTKVRQAEKRLERLDEVEKPWSPWRLQLTVEPATRGGDIVARLRGAIVERGAFRLGPVDLEVERGERVAIVGPNGSGKTTLLRALLGDVRLLHGTRELGQGVVVGELDQRRELFASDEPLLTRFSAESALRAAEARTLLAKFGIRREDALRPASSLSPGERSRAVLALLQALGANTLVLDEPTNHLDLEAIEQLESVLDDYPGTVLLVTHDRRFLQRFAPTRTVRLPL